MVDKTRERTTRYRGDIPPICLSTISVAIICISFVLANAEYISQLQMSKIAAATMCLFIIDQLVIKRLDY
jgi:hypothetical protein